MSHADTRGDERPTIDDIRAALDRIAASEAFCACPQLVAFLRYVVEATLRGRQDRIKGYTIAIEALGRGDDFNPQDDPIVRVEAMRLRRALQRYYANGGCDDSVRIELPVGSYVPVFRRAAPRIAGGYESARSQDAPVSGAVWHDFLLFLAAYLDEDKARAARYAALIPSEAYPLDVVARALVAADRGEAGAAKALLDRLGVLQRETREDSHAQLAQCFPAEAMARRIVRDFTQAEVTAAAKP